MANVEITVYGKPGCQQCRMTTQYLDRKRVPYTYRDVTKDQADHDMVALLGYQQLPVVTAGDMHWSGFRTAKLDQLIELYCETPDVAEYEAGAERYFTKDSAA